MTSILSVAFTIVFITFVMKTRISYPWYFEKLDIVSLQNRTKNNELCIAIIDSGFDSKYQKYLNKEVICYDASGENCTIFQTGHGSQIAMLIGSNSKLKKSIYGVNPNVQLISIRVTNSLGITTTEYLHNAFEICKQLDVKAVNVSLGGTTYSEILEKDIQDLKDNNILVACASGDKKSNYLYPANYNASYCIVAQKYDSSIYELSNYKSNNNKKAIASPGVDIDVVVSGIDNKIYIDKKSGSSYATAIFTSYYSLICSIDEEFNLLKLDYLIDNDLCYLNGYLNYNFK